MPKLEQNPSDANAMTADEYIKANYEPSDRLAVVVLNRNHGETIQRIATAEVIASPRFQAWLRHKNAHGSDIYISQNVLNEDADSRTKADVKAIRHVYLDLDHEGERALAKIESSASVPKPNFVINTSPGKYQVIWKVEGMNQAESENLMRAMVREFGGDPAATDSTRVLRLPGFFNKKYENGNKVEARKTSSQTYAQTDFKISLESSQNTSDASGQKAAIENPTTHQRTPSEHDWAWVMRRLERGESLGVLIQKVADYRDDKPNPQYYARLTVTRAYAYFKISRGQNPQEVARAISAHPPHPSENGEEYARSTVQRAIEQVARSRQQQHSEAGSPPRASQHLGLKITP
jgi:RepB DNA-primase N-terminal domain